MRIQNFKAEPDVTATLETLATEDPISVGEMMPEMPPPPDTANQAERQTLEIAFLNARIQHLDLVLETARSLMGSNHARLLRRLHELPREIVELSAQLRRLDPASVW